MTISEVGGRVTIDKYFRDFIDDCRRNDLFPESTIRALESKLLSMSAALSVVEAFRQAGAVYLDQINRSTIRHTKRLIRQTYNTPAQAGAVESAAGTAIRYGMDNGLFGHQSLKERDLYPLKQQRKSSAKVLQLSPEQVTALSTKPLGNTAFEQWRNTAIFKIYMLVHGLRSGTEIWRLNECDYNRQALEHTITREHGYRQTIALRKNDRNTVDMWLFQKHGRIEGWRKRGVVAADEDAFFISSEPRKKNGKLTWRMDTAQLINEFDKIRKMLGFPDEVKPGTLRHNSCTRMQAAAMVLGYHESYGCTLQDHGEQTERQHYSAIIGPDIENLGRSPEENVEFHEHIAAHAFARFLVCPFQLRHIGVIFDSLLVMGRLQRRVMMREYREDLLDLDNMPSNPYTRPIKDVLAFTKLICQKTVLCLCPWMSH